MGYDRSIVTKKDISPEMAQINAFLNGSLQEALNRYDLRYELESSRTIKTGKNYEDQIFVGAKRKFWKWNNGKMVADIRRDVSNKTNPSLEVRVLNQAYAKIIPEAIERCYRDLADLGRNNNITVFTNDHYI